MVERGVSAFNDRLFIPGLYYLLVIPVFFIPWTAYLPSVISRSQRSHSYMPFLLGWLLAPLVIFSFYATQLPHYMLPGYPALAILIALVCDQRPNRWGRYLAGGVSLVLIAISGIASYLGYAGMDANPELAVLVLSFATFVLLLAISNLIPVFGGHYAFAMVFLVMSSAAFGWFSSNARNAHITLRLAEEWTGVDSENPWKATGFTEPSLVWYGEHAWNFSSDEITGKSEIALKLRRRWRVDEDSIWALIRGLAVKPIEDHSAALGPHLEIPTKIVHGWSPGTNSWVEVALWKNAEMEKSENESGI